MKKSFLITLTALLFAAALFSGYKVWRYFADELETEEHYDNLAARIEQSPQYEQEQTPLTEQPGETPPAWTVYDQYGPLFEQNHDMIGWIAIPGTTIDYPVMQTPDNPNYYLNHSFEKKRSDYGVPYAAEGSRIDPQSDNITIYGHRMKSGKMFGILEKYKDEAFWRECPVIRFDTRADFGTYKIIAVFKVNPTDFPYHQFIDAADKAAFDEYMQRCKVLSFYDTGVSAAYGDKLITLSTCDSRSSNRFVVVAKKVQE